MDDGRLLRNYRIDGDESAAGELIERHRKMVFGVCYRVLGEVDIAKDASQAVFLLMLTKGDSLVNRTSLAGWLYFSAEKMAKNERRSMLRRQKRETEAMERMLLEKDGRRDLSNVFASVFDEALARLPEKYRSPLVMHYLEGMPQQEIAKLINVPAGTVNSLLSRGREMLRGQLRKAGCVVAMGQLQGSISSLIQSVPSCPEIAGPVLQATANLAVGASSANGAVSPQTMKLYEEMVKMMFYVKLKIAAAFVCILTVLVASALGGSMISTSEKTESKEKPKIVEKVLKAEDKVIVPEKTVAKSEVIKKPAIDLKNIASTFDKRIKEKRVVLPKKRSSGMNNLIANELKYSRSAAYVLGEELAKRYPNSKFLLLHLPNYKKNKRAFEMLEGFKEGVGGKNTDFEIDSPELKSSSIVSFSMMDLEKVANEHPDCDLIVSFIGLPKDFKKSDDGAQRKYVLLFSEIYSQYENIVSGLIDSAVTYRPGVKFSSNPCPDDPHEAFAERYMIITADNVAKVAEKHPPTFKSSDSK